jgi:signal transduction histidine kinase
VRTALTALVGLLITLLVAVIPSVYFAYRAPALSGALETAVTLVGTLIALLCLGRFRRHGRLGDLAIVSAAALFAFGFPVLGLIPRALFGAAGQRGGQWSPLVVRLLTASLLFLATSTALSPRRLPSRRLPWWALLLVPFALAAGVTALLVWGAPRQTHLLVVELSERPDPFGDVLVAAIELLAGGLFGLAAIRFSRRAGRPGETPADPFLGWLGSGCALAAVASLDYALFPSLSTGWLYVGDLFRAGAVLAWAVGAVGEITSYWSELAQLARAEERRRLARDLHDGLAQELAFLASHAQASGPVRSQPDWLVQLVAGAERALAESRRAIAALVADDPPSLEADLTRTAVEIADRTGASVDLDVAPGDVDPAQQEMLVRIVREAVTNAIRHGHAERISVQLTDGSHPVLRVCDDGSGFSVDRPVEGGGFGLVSMRERAATLGASLVVRSSPGAGTTVEVVWP